VTAVTAAVQEPASPELLGSVGGTMTQAVVLLAADMPAEWALRHLDRQAVSGGPVVDHGRVVGVVTRRDLLVPCPSGEATPTHWPACGSVIS